MQFVYNDGGRAAAGYKGHAGDCVCRSIAIACELDYKEVYDALNIARTADPSASPATRRKLANSSSRTGIYKRTYRKFLEDIGWLWTPTMGIGTGCQVHLCTEELPPGRIIARCSHHLTAVIDGIIHDIYDPSREGTRAVYGYFRKT